MLAALFFLGVSVAAVSVAGFGALDGDEQSEDDASSGALAETSAGSEGGPEPEGPVGFAPLVSDAPPMVGDTGETGWDWSGIGEDAPLLPQGDGGDTPAVPLGGNPGAPLSPVDGPGSPSGSDLSDALLPEGANTPEVGMEGFEAVEVREWVSPGDPVDITGFDPGDEILHVTLFASPDAEAVDVELAPSSNGQDGEIRVSDQVLAVIRGVPEITSETVRFSLADLPA